MKQHNAGKEREGRDVFVKRLTPYSRAFISVAFIIAIILTGIHLYNPNLGSGANVSRVSEPALAQAQSSSSNPQADPSVSSSAAMSAPTTKIASGPSPIDPKLVASIITFPVSYGSGASPPGSPFAYDSGNGYMYVTVGQSSTTNWYVAALEGTNVALISVPAECTHLAYDSGNGYIYAGCLGYVEIISGTSVVGSISVSLVNGDAPNVAYNPSNGYVYAAEPSSNLYVISGTSLAATLATTGGNAGATYNPSNGYIYTASGGTVYVTSGTSSYTTLTLPDCAGYAPTVTGNMTYNPSNGDIYVAFSAGSEFEVDLISGTSVAASCINLPQLAGVPTPDSMFVYNPVNHDMYMDVPASSTSSPYYTIPSYVFSGTSIVTPLVISSAYAYSYANIAQGNGYVYMSAMVMRNGAYQPVALALSNESVVGEVGLGETVSTVDVGPAYPIAYDPSNGYLYVAYSDEYSQGSISVLSFGS